MVKEITVHKAMIAFWMLFRQANVFIHVKGDDVLEANLACFMHFNQRLVGGQRGTTGWQTQDERTVRGWFKCINAVNDMAGSPFTDLLSGYRGISLILHLYSQSRFWRIGASTLRRVLQQLRRPGSIRVDFLNDKISFRC